jgi:hypothetical protein
MNSKRIEKGLYQSRLADSRRAGDEDDLSLAHVGLCEPVRKLLELGLATDEWLHGRITVSARQG